MRVSAVTRRGSESESSQDRVLIGSRVLCDEEFSGEFAQPCAVGISDGVGGNAGGDIAADFVCRGLSRFDGDVFTPEGARRVNAELLEYAGKVPGMESMAATFSGIFPGGNLLHVGNTRICAVQGGYLKQLTTDMTTYNYLMSLGRTEEAEHCRRSEITACFGGGRESFYSPAVLELDLSGTLLFTSDGIHDFVSIDELEELLAFPASDIEICRSIIGRALKNGSADDMSVALVRF